MYLYIFDEQEHKIQLCEISRNFFYFSMIIGSSRVTFPYNFIAITYRFHGIAVWQDINLDIATKVMYLLL